MEKIYKPVIGNLNRLFLNWSGRNPENIIQLPNSGSSRVYFRLYEKNRNALGVYNENTFENLAFIKFTEHFIKFNVPVPKIYLHELQNNIYLIEDLGDIQLLNWLNNNRETNDFPDIVLEMYKKVLQNLINFQITAGKNLDYSYCYPFKSFDKEAILFDLNYFKVNFIESFNLKFNLNKLESDFEHLAGYLLKTDSDFFMYRDFQSRNILIKNNEPYFIDYQGGRKGALQYDLASLLYQAKANIPETSRMILLNYYMNEVNKQVAIKTDEFIEFFYGFAFLRILQTLGAYGRRGLQEGKKHFIESIPPAIKNLKFITEKTGIVRYLPELKSIINQLNE